MGHALNAGRSWTGGWLIVDMEDLNPRPPSENHVKKESNSKRWTFKTETVIFEFHVERAKYCKRGSRHPPLCTNREATQSNNFNKHLQKKKEKPEFQVQILKLDMVLWCSMGDHVYRNHVAPRTKLHVPRDDSPTPLTCTDVQRQTKQALMYFKRRSSMIIGTHGWRQVTVWTLDLCDTIRAAQQKSTRRTHVGLRQTDETGHNMTRKHLARRSSSVSKGSMRRPLDNFAEEKPKLDAARDQRGIHSIPDHGKQCQKRVGRWGGPQRCLAESPHQPTRTVQAGSDPYRCSETNEKRSVLKFQSVQTALRKNFDFNFSERRTCVSVMFAWRCVVYVIRTRRIDPKTFCALPSNRWRLQRLRVLQYATKLSHVFHCSHCIFVTILFRLFIRLFLNLSVRKRARVAEITNWFWPTKLKIGKMPIVTR